MIQDILTRRILEQNKFIDDEDIFGKGGSGGSQALKSTFM